MQRIDRRIQPSANFSIIRRFGSLILGALVAFLGLSITGTARADATWTSNVSGNWYQTNLWNSSQVPNGGIVYFGTSSHTPYTVTVDNVTADFVSDTMINNAATIGGNGNFGGDRTTLLINYTNQTAIFRVGTTYVANAGNGQPSSDSLLRIENGVYSNTAGFNLGRVFGSYVSSGRVEVAGGKLYVGGNYTIAGYSQAIQTGGEVDIPGALKIESTLPGGAQYSLNGGTMNLGTFFLGYSGTGTTGIFSMAGGVLNLSSNIVGIGFRGIAAGAYDFGQMIVTGGTVNAIANVAVGGPQDSTANFVFSKGELDIGGSATFNVGTNLYLGFQSGGFNNAYGSKIYVNGGTLNVLNGALIQNTLSISADAGWHTMIVSNGTVNVKDLFLDLGDGIFDGGLVNVTNNMRFSGTAALNGHQTGQVEVASSAVLQWTPGASSTMTVGVTTADAAAFTNRNGGTIRFVGANANDPNIIVNAGSSFVTTNANIEFKNVGAANLAGHVATAIAYQGTNALSFNNSTNATIANFVLDNASAGVGALFSSLTLSNASMFQAGTLTNSAIGTVTMYDTGKMIVTNALVNSGLIRGGIGSTPGLTSTALFNQASGVITGITTIAINGGGLTNAGAIYLNAGTAAITGPVTNSGTLKFANGSSATISGTMLDNTGLIAGDASSTVSLTATTLVNHAGGVIPGTGTLTVNAGFLNNSGLITADGSNPQSITADTLYNHNGGIISGQVTVLVSGGLTNAAGTIYVANRNLTVGGLLTNDSSGIVQLVNGAGTFSAVQNAGTFAMSGSVGHFGGVVTNTGMVRMNNSLGTFNAVVVNNGGWIDDPTTNTFLSGYTLGSAGSLSMAAGDVFVFQGGNFVNHSTQSNTYNTIDGKFVFSGGPGATQAFAVAGLNLAALTPTGTNDVGAGGSPLDPHSISYFQNNFALGTLEIAANTTVEVWNASSSSLAGLFLSNLVMGANSALIISNAVQVYYISTNAAFGANVVLLQPNQGLAGASGFHELVIPEPSTLLLAGAGLLTLWRVRRKLARSRHPMSG